MIDKAVEGEMGDVENSEVCQLILSGYVYINVCLLYQGECVSSGAQCCEKGDRAATGRQGW